jgi:hypothetical protein
MRTFSFRSHKRRTSSACLRLASIRAGSVSLPKKDLLGSEGMPENSRGNVSRSVVKSASKSAIDFSRVQLFPLDCIARARLLPCDPWTVWGTDTRYWSSLERGVSWRLSSDIVLAACRRRAAASLRGGCHHVHLQSASRCSAAHVATRWVRGPRALAYSRPRRPFPWQAVRGAPLRGQVGAVIFETPTAKEAGDPGRF